MVIREAVPADDDLIRGLLGRAFGQGAEAALVDRLRAGDGITLSMVAELDGVVVGHILFSPVVIRDDESVFAAEGLGPMAVDVGMQKRGIGSALVRAGLEAMRQRGCAGVVVLGHPEYYPRFGFERASRYGIRWEHDAPDEAFMVCVLDDAAFRGRHGLVSYRPEFSVVS